MTVIARSNRAHIGLPALAGALPALVTLLAALTCAEGLASSGDVVPAALDATAGAMAASACPPHGYFCDCPGCRAYYNACGITCPGAMPKNVPSSETPSAAPSTESGESPYGGVGSSTMTGPSPSLQGGLGAVAVSNAASPSMIGDFFGGGYQFAASSDFPRATVSIAGGDRVMKFSDNNSPLPENRVFFNYHHFQNALVDVHGNNLDADRFTFGLERTLFDGLTSVELRVPFTAALDATESLNSPDTRAAEFGNLGLAFKLLAYNSGAWSVGTGLGIIFPTAADSVFFNDLGNQAVSVTNDAYFLQPFVGVYYKPNNRLFMQFVSQVNFDVNRNLVTVTDPNAFVGGAVGSDRIRQQTLLFLDYSVGYWMFRSKRPCDWVTGVAPMFELHYTSTLTPLDLPNIPDEVFEPDFRRDALNATGGVYFTLWQTTALKIAGVTPLLGGTNRLFDSEIGMQLIHSY